MLIDKFPSAKRGCSSLSIRCKCQCGTVVKLNEISDFIPVLIPDDVMMYEYQCPYCLEERRVNYRKWDKITNFIISQGISSESICRLERLSREPINCREYVYEVLCLQKETGLSINKKTRDYMEKHHGDVLEAFNKGELPSEFDDTAFRTWEMECFNAHKGALPDYRILKVATVTKRNSNGYKVPDKVVLRGNDNKCIVLKVDNKGNVTEEWTEPGIYFDKYYVNGFTP